MILVTFLSCKKENAFDCLKSNGVRHTEIRSLLYFDKVEVNDKIEVTLVKGQNYSAEVRAGKNIIKNIRTEVKDATLKIENKNTCNFVRGYKHKIEIVVTVPYLSTLIHKSVSDIYFDKDFKQDSIFVDVESSGSVHLTGEFDCIRTLSDGNGDLYLSGSTKRLETYTQGTNYIHAENLTVTDLARVELFSLGDCYLDGNGLQRLEYRIGKSGNLYYSGDIRELSGTYDNGAKGRLIHNN